MQYASLTDFMAEEKAKILESCTGCGACIRACPGMGALGLGAQETADLPGRLLSALTGGELSETVFKWVFGCNHCAFCRSACPQDGADPVLLNSLLRHEFLRRGDPRIARMHQAFTSPGGGFKRSFMVMQQLLSDDIRWLTSVPDRPDPVDIVLVTGCTGMVRPDIIHALLDIMDLLGVRYAALGGTDFCCGSPLQFIGDLNGFEQHIRRLYAGIMAFRPRRVLFACAECLHNGLHMAAHLFDRLPVQESALKYIAGSLDRLGLQKQPRTRVTFHDSCSLGRLCGDCESPRTILTRLPGVEFVEMRHTGEQAPCCGAPSEAILPGKNEPLRRMRLEDFRKTGAETMITTCVGCEFSYRRWRPDGDFPVMNLFPFLARSLGIVRPDPFDPFIRSQDVEGMLDRYRDAIQNGPFDEAECRAVVARMLGAGPKTV